MKNGKKPDPNVIHPIAGYDKEIYVKPTIGTIFFALLIAFLLVGCKAKDSKPSPEINPISQNEGLTENVQGCLKAE